MKNYLQAVTGWNPHHGCSTGKVDDDRSPWTRVSSKSRRRYVPKSTVCHSIGFRSSGRTMSRKGRGVALPPPDNNPYTCLSHVYTVLKGNSRGRKDLRQNRSKEPFPLKGKQKPTRIIRLPQNKCHVSRVQHGMKAARKKCNKKHHSRTNYTKVERNMMKKDIPGPFTRNVHFFMKNILQMMKNKAKETIETKQIKRKSRSRGNSSCAHKVTILSIGCRKIIYGAIIKGMKRKGIFRKHLHSLHNQLYPQLEDSMGMAIIYGALLRHQPTPHDTLTYNNYFTNVRQLNNESAISYISRFRDAMLLATSVGNSYSEGELIDLFLNGVNRDSKYSSQALALQSDRRHETLHPNNNIGLTMAQVEMCFTSLDEHVTKKRYNAFLSSDVCGYCGKPGHHESKCRKKFKDKKTKRVPLSEVTCHICKRKGHYANQCPSRHKPKEGGNTATSTDYAAMATNKDACCYSSVTSIPHV